MTVVGGAFAPNDEVDEVRWASGPEAAALLSYEWDADLVARFRAPTT
jgi:8-oxo-dGTP diphosphatase